MNTNPDINRLSLEDRIEALENRLPSGGGSALSGLSYMNAQDIDNAGNNTFTKVEGGWIVKFEIPNTSNLSGATYTGLKIRCAMLIPQVGGLLLSPRQVVMVAERLTNLNIVYNQQYAYNYSWSLGNQELLGTLDGTLWIFQDLSFRFAEKKTDNSAYFCAPGLACSINNTGTPQKFVISGTMRSTTTGTHTLGPSRMVGVFMLPTAFPGFNNRSSVAMICGGAPKYVAGETIATGQQFNARFHDFLPASWR